MTNSMAQQTLELIKRFRVESILVSEGLDFYDNHLWQTHSGGIRKFEPDAAVDSDGDGDYELIQKKRWIFNHNKFSESAVWFNNELYNFTFMDNNMSWSNDIFTLVLNDDETYTWEHVGNGESTTNWGSCRDKNNPGQYIIYTGHYTNALMWYEPATGNTVKNLQVPELDDIEDIGMDEYGTIWATSNDYVNYPDIYRIDPETGTVLETFYRPHESTKVIDGIAIRSMGDYEVMYVIAKMDPYIWLYKVPPLLTTSLPATNNKPILTVHNVLNEYNINTKVSICLQSDAQINLSIFNTCGQKVKTLLNQTQAAGTHTYYWDGRDESGKKVSTGVYLFKILIKTEAGVSVQTAKGII